MKLPKFKMRYGHPHVLVRWTGRDAPGDKWEPLENLNDCEEDVAAFERDIAPCCPVQPKISSGLHKILMERMIGELREEPVSNLKH